MIEDKILWVARYVEKDMNDAEIADFEQTLITDEELQLNLSEYKNIHQSLEIKFANNEEFKQTLNGLNKQYFYAEPKIVSLKPTIKWLGAVAAILIIGLFIWAPWNSNLYTAYADDSQMLVTERGAELPTELDEAAALFNEKDFEAAKASLEKLYVQEPSNAMVGYYYGLTLLKTNEVEKSRTVLNRIYEGESVFKYEAAYTIALGYLKVDNKTDCKVWLQKIPAETTRYQQAKELIKKLE